MKYIIMGLGVIKSFYTASALGPTIMGSFAVIMLIVEYLNYLNLGVFASMNRDVAIHMEEQKKKEYVDDIINTALSFTIIPIAIITLCFLLIEFIEFSFIPNEFKEYSWIILILVAFNQLKIFLLRYLRLYSKYYELTILEFLTQIMNLTGVVLFVGEYSIDAVIWSVLISTIFFNTIAFIYVKRIRFQINYSLVKYLIVSGLPMLFYALILTLLSSIDRMVIAASFESRALGLYHLGFISAQGLFMAFNSIALLFYPRWLKYFHEQDSENKFNAIKEQTLMIELILVCLSLVGIFLIPLFVNLLLPEYKVSILITQFLLIALIANGLTFVTSTFLISNNHQIKIVPIVSFVILLALVMNYFFIWLGYGLYGIATSTTIAFYTYAFIMTILTLNITSSFSLSNILFFYKRLIFFVPFTLILLYEKFNLVWVFLLFLIIYFNLTKDLMVKFIKLYKSQRLN